MIYLYISSHMDLFIKMNIPNDFIKKKHPMYIVFSFLRQNELMSDVLVYQKVKAGETRIL